MTAVSGVHMPSRVQVLTLACDPTTPEVEARASEVQTHPWLQSELEEISESILDYVH